MIAYKFLQPDRVAPFSGVTWPEKGWVETQAPLVPCRTGIHACRAADLAYWLTDDLWEVELDGQVIESRFKLVAGRARLLRHLDAWDADARQDFIEMCLARVAKHAADEVAEAGRPDAAKPLTDPRVLRDHESLRQAAHHAAAALPKEERVGRRLAGFVEDAVEWVTLPPSGLAYVAAHAADTRSRPQTADPFAAERDQQSRWLTERLRLRDSPG